MLIKLHNPNIATAKKMKSVLRTANKSATYDNVVFDYDDKTTLDNAKSTSRKPKYTSYIEITPTAGESTKHALLVAAHAAYILEKDVIVEKDGRFAHISPEKIDTIRRGSLIGLNMIGLMELAYSKLESPQVI